jgi:hypothetical protein
LDEDLADLYEVETKQLKRQVRRNIDCFPDDFMFELTREEFDNLRSQIGTSNWGHDEDIQLIFAYLKKLMVILLVVGAMDLRAMAGVAVAMTAERLAPAGWRMATAIGVVTVGAGLFTILLPRIFEPGKTKKPLLICFAERDQFVSDLIRPECQGRILSLCRRNCHVDGWRQLDVVCGGGFDAGWFCRPGDRGGVVYRR